MTLWAVIPVKPFRLGKSRLATTLSEGERYALNRCLFENTLAVLRSLPEVSRILVVSRDSQALSMARRQRALTIQEGSDSDLNAALQKATQVALQYRIFSLLILPADLPLVNAADLHHLVEAGKEPPVVAIVPDRHRTGTNALLTNPTGIIRYMFGEGSFQQHCQAARLAGARLETFDLPRLALDLDTPEDLEYLQKMNFQMVC